MTSLPLHTAVVFLAGKSEVTTVIGEFCLDSRLWIAIALTGSEMRFSSYSICQEYVGLAINARRPREGCPAAWPPNTETSDPYGTYQTAGHVKFPS